MRLPFLTRDYFIEPLQPADSAEIARLHADDFVRPWADEEFAALMAQATVFGFASREVGRPREATGFVLARLAAGEGEILTVAVARAHRRAGLGRALMDAVLRELHAERAESLFLEVDETNAPALALYRRLGFQQVGRRPGYYEHGRGAQKTGALVMRKSLK